MIVTVSDWPDIMPDSGSAVSDERVTMRSPQSLTWRKYRLAAKNIGWREAGTACRDHSAAAATRPDAKMAHAGLIQQGLL